MAHPRVYGSEAVILRRIDFGEADRILTLFTPTYGKVRAVAKGVRRTTSRLAGHLEPFTRTQLLLATGRDLDIGTQAEAKDRLAARGPRGCRRQSGGGARGPPPSWWIVSWRTPPRPHASTRSLSRRCAAWRKARASALPPRARAGWRCATSSCACWMNSASGPTCITAFRATRRS